MAYQPLTRNSTFFENQDNLGCGRHALNNFFGGKYFVKSSDSAYTYDELVTVGRDLSTDTPMDLLKVCRFLQTNPTTSATGGECPDNENYDISVLIYALKMAGYDVEQHFSIPETNTPYLGFITNESGTSTNSGHWVSVRNIDSSSNVILTDSLTKDSRIIPFTQYRDKFNRAPTYYRVISIKERSPDNASKSIKSLNIETIRSRLQEAKIKEKYINIITGILITATPEDLQAVLNNPNYTITEDLIETYKTQSTDPINIDNLSKVASHIISLLKGTVTKTIDDLSMNEFFNDHGSEVPPNHNTIFPITKDTAAAYLTFVLGILDKFESEEEGDYKKKIKKALDNNDKTPVFTVFTTGLGDPKVLKAWKSNKLTEKIIKKLKNVQFRHYDERFTNPADLSGTNPADLSGTIFKMNFTFKNFGTNPFFIIDCAHCYKYNKDGTKVGLSPEYQSDDSSNKTSYIPPLGEDVPIVYLGYPDDVNLFNSDFFTYENGKIVTYIDKMREKGVPLDEKLPGNHTYEVYPNEYKQDPNFINLWT